MAKSTKEKLKRSELLVRKYEFTDGNNQDLIVYSGDGHMNQSNMF